MNKHTAGTWSIDTDDLEPEHAAEVHAFDTGRWICSVAKQSMSTGEDSDESEAMANARLIAAAPELLAALETVALLPLHGDGTGSIRKMVRAAIAKATVQ